MTQSTLERSSGFTGDSGMNPVRREYDANRAGAMALGVLSRMSGDGQVGKDFESPPERHFPTDGMVPPSNNIG